jgi:hypothetical protein
MYALFRADPAQQQAKATSGVPLGKVIYGDAVGNGIAKNRAVWRS